MRQHRKRVRLVGGNSISGGTCCRTELLGRVNDDDTCRATDLSMKDTTKVMSTTALITQTTCDVTIPFLQHARCMRGACAVHARVLTILLNPSTFCRVSGLPATTMVDESDADFTVAIRSSNCEPRKNTHFRYSLGYERKQSYTSMYKLHESRV